MKTVRNLFPLLFVHALAAVLYSRAATRLLSGQNRYITMVHTLLKSRDVVPWAGPGYPLFIFPFITLDLPLIFVRLANTVVLFAGFIYLFHTLRHYVSGKWAYGAVYSLGLFPILLEYSPRIFTEPLCVFLACGFGFHYVHMSTSPKRRRLHLLVASLYLGYLALTKVLFGYVLAAAIVIFLIVLILTRRRSALRAFLVVCIALAVCCPYLYHTYSASGKVFYWSQAGGLSLYWMSTPYENEYGNWIGSTKPWLMEYTMVEDHREFFGGLQGLRGWERDDRLRDQAIRNITEHPGKFAKNWVANLGRLFLHYPYSYTYQSLRDLMYIVPGMALVFLFVLCAVYTVANWSRMHSGVLHVLLIAMLYIGGNSLLSAYNRMLIPVLPLLAIWITYVLANITQPGFRSPFKRVP